MEREVLDRLLTDDTEATIAARDALLNGGAFVVWNGSSPAEPLAQVYERRLRRSHRIGQETLGLKQAVQQLRQRNQPIRLVRVDASDGSWVFMLFLDEEGLSLVACTGVRQRRE